MMENNHDNALRQKLMLMENAVSQVSTVKAQLRFNAEVARKEINNVISHQMALIRAREQHLLNELESVVEAKERTLGEQQEHLNQAIGACQQSMEYTLRNKSENDHQISNSCFRMNTHDLKPRTNSHLVFKCDPSAMRRALYTFGAVYSDPTIKDRLDCLPLDVDSGDDSAQLAHKSILRMRHPHSEGDDDLSRWLARNTIAESELDDYEFVSQSVTSDTFSECDNQSSVKSVVPSDNTTKDYSSKFQQPLSYWLAQSVTKQILGETPCNVLPGLKRGTPVSDYVIDKASSYVNTLNDIPAPKPKEQSPANNENSEQQRLYGFIKVIQDIKDSTPEKWLKKSDPEPESQKPESTYTQMEF